MTQTFLVWICPMAFLDTKTYSKGILLISVNAPSGDLKICEPTVQNTIRDNPDGLEIARDFLEFL
jgi:hypothetical protein